MKEYVAGFLFNEDRDQVVLILKARPDWQAGMYNAIGGRVETENEEHADKAMRREFWEETGLDVATWREFATLWDERGWVVRFYWAIGNIWVCRQTTDEEPEIFPIDELPDNIIPNLRWLIPMALSIIKGERCDSFVIRQFKTRASFA